MTVGNTDEKYPIQIDSDTRMYDIQINYLATLNFLLST